MGNFGSCMKKAHGYLKDFRGYLKGLYNRLIPFCKIISSDISNLYQETISDSSKRLIPVILFFVLTIWLLWMFIVVFAKIIGANVGIQEIGQWGDSFGALNSLFSALGFSAVIMTLLLQQKQNRINEADQHRLRFESSYFELLKMIRENSNLVEFSFSNAYRKERTSISSANFVGSSAFAKAWQEMEYFIDKFGINMIAKSAVETIYLQNIHQRYENNLGIYFRLIYSVLKRIREDKHLTEDEKIFYANLLRGQLTSNELILIGLNALTSISNDFGDLIVEFKLLKYLPEKDKRRDVLKRFYPAEAFLGRS